jgi:hypothetical protein
MRRIAAVIGASVAFAAAPAAAQEPWPFERATTLPDRVDDFELQGNTIYTRGAGRWIVAHPGGQRLRLP